MQYKLFYSVLMSLGTYSLAIDVGQKICEGLLQPCLHIYEHWAAEGHSNNAMPNHDRTKDKCQFNRPA